MSSIQGNFRKFGDRTSSLISLYPHFLSFENHPIEGELRYLAKKGVVAIANEPLASHQDRRALIQSFIGQDRFRKKDKLVFPISDQLASELKQIGMHTWQIGAEPIFVLSDYFNCPQDILQDLPIARNLKRKGAIVREINETERSALHQDILELKEHWLSSRKPAALEFLNIVDPLAHDEYKRYFTLTDRKKVMALLTATPVYLSEQIIGYYFNDVLKRSEARSATSELLIIEAMRLLHQEGVIEVRLGMCPLAMISRDAQDAGKLTWLFENWRWGYQFKTLYEFKNKLKPTKWRPLHLASSRPGFYRMIRNVFAVHVPEGFLRASLKKYSEATRRGLELREKIQDRTPSHLGAGVLPTLSRIKWTVSMFVFFVTLHLLKQTSLTAAHWYDVSPYMPGDVTLAGLFIGPLFHNHLPHLLGDQLSFLIFGGALEYAFGTTFLLWITALGLWLSNPVTHLLLAATLKLSSPLWWGKVLLEKDYGSSNAVFALVGASLYVLKRRAWLFWPFALHALFICLQRESFLAIHHFMGILLGYAGARLLLSQKRCRSPDPRRTAPQAQELARSEGAAKAPEKTSV